MKELFEAQQDLDELIYRTKKVAPMEIRDELYLSLLVEVGELANETRCFKYWSNKGPSPKELILEEFADCMHFTLSIGLREEFAPDMIRTHIHSRREGELPFLFNALYFSITRLYENPTFAKYVSVWDYLMTIGRRLGFTTSDVCWAYTEKNDKNLRRQESGY